MVNAVRSFSINSSIERNNHKTIVSTKTLRSNITAIDNGYWEYKNNLGLIGKKVVLGLASVCDERKGLNNIINLQTYDNEKIIIIGVTKSQQNKLPKKVISFVRTDSVDTLRKLYCIADVYLNPTYEDNYPTTNLEAIA